MVYAEILAGGSGNRYGDNIPKQFVKIYDKPIIIYTVEAFLTVEEIDVIVICCKDEWKNFIKDEIKKFIKTNKKIIYAKSSSDRNKTVIEGCKEIEKQFGIKDDDIVITHDGVRPILSECIIKENIKMARKYNAVGTYFKVTDTISLIRNNIVEDIPDRTVLYNAHSPQTFNLKKLVKYYENTSEKDLEKMTDTAKIFKVNGEKIYAVMSDQNNIKLTYKNDLYVIKSLIKERRG